LISSPNSFTSPPPPTGTTSQPPLLHHPHNTLLVVCFRLRHQHTGNVTYTLLLQLFHVTALSLCFRLARITCCAIRHIVATYGAVPTSFLIWEVSLLKKFIPK
jgi:hypothetical protein